MLLSFTLLGVLLSIILFYYSLKGNKASIYLSGFFFFVSFYAFVQYTLLYSKSAVLIGIIYLNFACFHYLIGPLLYWYIRSVLNDDYNLNGKDSWHFFPSIVYLLFILPHLFSTWEYKYEIAQKFAENSNALISVSSSTVPFELSNFIIFITRPLSAFVYIIISAKLLYVYKKEHKDRNVFEHQRYMTKWLPFLLIVFFVLVISHVLLMLFSQLSQNVVLFYSLNILQVSSIVGILILLISPFFFPSILYGMPQVKQIDSMSEITSDINNFSNDELLVADNQEKRERKMEEDYLHLIDKKVVESMNEHHPFLNPEFNMAMLSVLINIPVHHLAYYFKEYKKQSISDFRSLYRIEFAKKMMIEGKASELTLEAIAKLSGFTTRNTFLLAFKKVEGLTPKEYLDRIQKAS